MAGTDTRMVRWLFLLFFALCLGLPLLLFGGCARQEQQSTSCRYQVGHIVQTRLTGAEGIVTRTYGRPCVYLVKFNQADVIPLQEFELEPQNDAGGV